MKKIKRVLFAIFRSNIVRATFSGYQWYRKLHGGRWERWWIGPCCSSMWLPIADNLPEDHRQPCSEGPCMGREDYTYFEY